MSEKVYVRKVETWTVSAGSEPIEVNVDALRNCEPPYEGESDEDLATYLWENVFNNYDWYDNDTNKEVYGEDAAYDLSFEMCEGMEEYFDSRTKGEDAWVQVGVPNPEWTKYGGFQVTAEGKYNSEW